MTSVSYTAKQLSRRYQRETTVGQRHGRPIVIEVDAAAMHADGHHFYLSENKVWLTEAVPPTYLIFG